MESQGNTQIKIGIYLAIGTICILGSIFFLGADKALFRRYVKIHAHFEQVQGLAVGSVVSLSGVTVGNVQDITFLPDENKLDVTMSIDEKFLKRIRKESAVEIRTQGALGDKFVLIFPGDPRQPEVKDGDVLPLAKASDLLGILTERGGEAGKIFDVVNEVYKMAHTINAENRMEKIMMNFDTASSNLAQTSKDIQKIVGNSSGGVKLNHSIEKLDSILTKIDKGEGSLGLLINDPSIHNQLKAALGGGGTQRKNQVKTLLRTSIEKED
ncbi:MlaD family protein [Bdellovibrio svalbardensis]|uniref:MlaD family protein n=1 Tax=Bdellovibrio svalbardensis TaxID=2972972 RepID=A0ABT6DET6_9BACT|nr:MlaD family protein [Bdellovibrio svalbardensis]MDG0815347.1 MlaD family protein [Bdellovibrio svalbardensis]